MCHQHIQWNKCYQPLGYFSVTLTFLSSQRKFIWISPTLKCRQSLYYTINSWTNHIFNFNGLCQHALYKPDMLYKKFTGSKLAWGWNLHQRSSHELGIVSYYVLKWRLTLVVMATAQLQVDAERTNVLRRLIFYFWCVGVLKL